MQPKQQTPSIQDEEESETEVYEDQSVAGLCAE